MKFKAKDVDLKVLFFAILLLALIGCRTSRNTNTTRSANASNSGSTANSKINDVYTARDDNGDPGQRTEVFGPGDRTIHCVVRLKDPTPETKVRFSWWVVTATGAQDEKLKDIDYTTKEKENIIHSNLFLQKDWPPGKYKVDVYVNESLDRTANFSVE